MIEIIIFGKFYENREMKVIKVGVLWIVKLLDKLCENGIFVVCG